ncbi:hypothetical protein DFAR_750006 [Desulfarculales bacterium]
MPARTMPSTTSSNPLMPLNTTLYVVAHASCDRAWLLCDSPYGLW